MPENLHSDPPLLTADLPGIGGRIKVEPEDFEVEEIPAYEPSGAGDFLYLWVEKRDLGAEYFQRQVAQRLDIAPGEVGTAGLKDRRAVTRQWVSVPAAGRGAAGAARRRRHARPAGQPAHQQAAAGPPARQPLPHPHPRRASRRPQPVVAADSSSGCGSMACPTSTAHSASAATARRCDAGPGAAARREAGAARCATRSSGSWPCRRRSRPCSTTIWASGCATACCGSVLPGDVMAKYPFGGMFVAEDVRARAGAFRRAARSSAPGRSSAGRLSRPRTRPREREAADARGTFGLTPAVVRRLRQAAAGHAAAQPRLPRRSAAATRR